MFALIAMMTPKQSNLDQYPLPKSSWPVGADQIWKKRENTIIDLMHIKVNEITV